MARYRYSWTQAATKHGIAHSRSQYVIEHCGQHYTLTAEPPDRPERLLFLGDDRNGVALEVIAVELLDGTLRVIHSMEMRPQYNRLYREAKPWRR
ncbi:hypothetical protein O7606_20725 [Micromonospora sp. WMMD882]|uniref:hypothetical protein n=1 Tax=Micromonospora sp. WMMD882 TaxID=3015151 RepID=UPI00248C2C9E|nr:hypothetical protein [Micromonospora sp. WMMD882]WBB78617.1 hypothetical protein O7606_20725 [Micromonospora sp. WMMD882]